MSETSGDPEVTHLPPSAPPTNHGHTTAAWVTVIVVMAGGLISAVSFAAGAPVLVWTGGGVMLVGLIAGAVLRMLGFGQPPAGARDTRDTRD